MTEWVRESAVSESSRQSLTGSYGDLQIACRLDGLFDVFDESLDTQGHKASLNIRNTTFWVDHHHRGHGLDVVHRRNVSVRI